MAKVSQREAAYQRGYPMKQCGICRMYMKKNAPAPFGSCTAVSGSISPWGLCRFWHTLDNPWGNKLTGQSRATIEAYYDSVRGGPGK